MRAAPGAERPRGHEIRQPAPEGFAPLARTGPEPPAQAGCALALGLFLLFPGSGAVVLYFTHPQGKGSPWVMLVVGLAFAAFGLLLVLAGVTGLRGIGVPRPWVFLERGAVLRPGGRARLVLRQPGPARFDSFTVRLLAERVYLRRVKRDSTATVEDREILREETLLELRDWRVPSGPPADRELELIIPPGAPPTGPARPEGTVRWLVEVRGDAGVLRGTYHPFAIEVEPAPAVPVPPPPA